MKKTYIQPLQEITAQDVQLLNEYLEQGMTTLLKDFFQTSDGVFGTGLAVTSGGVSSLNVSTGFIVQSGVFGQIEGASGLVMSLPVSGTRTDLVVASYFEAIDTPASGYVLVDVTTRQEQIQTNPSRKFGAIKLAVLQNTVAAGAPAGKIPLYEVTCSSTTITGIVDVRIFAKIQRFANDIQQDFMSLWYSMF